MNSTNPKDIIKYCPKCGNPKFNYKQDNSFICTDCKFHLYINASAAVAALIVNEKGELLLTRRAVEPEKGMLDLPGGFIDVKETAEHALCREIKEELNLEIQEFTYFMSFPNEYVFSGISVFTIDLAYICSTSNFYDIEAKDDINGFEFYQLENLPLNKIGLTSIRKIVEAFIKNQ